jgi:hypothetical protein
MEDILVKNSIVVLGVMFASILGGFFSLMSLVAQKEQKVSEFRQEWINSLRNSISEYIATLQHLAFLQIQHDEKPESEFDSLQMAKETEDTYIRGNKSYNDIIFRVNDSEKNAEIKKINDKFLNCLEKTRELFNDDDWTKLHEIQAHCDDLRLATKPLLKEEWKRVKAGEPIYRLSKRFSAALLIIGFLVFSYSSYQVVTGLQNTPEVTQNETDTTQFDKSMPNKSSNTDGKNAAGS